MPTRPADVTTLHEQLAERGMPAWLFGNLVRAQRKRTADRLAHTPRWRPFRRSFYRGHLEVLDRYLEELKRPPFPPGRTDAPPFPPFSPELAPPHDTDAE